MTYATRLLSGLVLLTLVGCGLTDDPPADPPGNPLTDDTVVFTARLNGEPWTGEGPRSAFFLGNDMSVSATDPDEARYPYEHHVVFFIPFEGVGEYA